MTEKNRKAFYHIALHGMGGEYARRKFIGTRAQARKAGRDLTTDKHGQRTGGFKIHFVQYISAETAAAALRGEHANA